MYLRLLLGCGLIFSIVASAEQAGDEATPENTPLASEVEFGYQSNSGNTNSQALNTRLSFQYTSGRQRHSGEFELHKQVKDGVEDKFQLIFEAQSDYKLGQAIYLYGVFKGVDTRHSAYFKDYTVSGGIGYQLANSDELLIELELGPGYRYQEPNLDEIEGEIIFPNTVQEPILRGQINALWHLTASFSLATKMTLTSGESNSKLSSELGAINNITEDIALKVVYERQRHNRVPEGLSETDSSLSVNLLFYFD